MPGNLDHRTKMIAQPFDSALPVKSTVSGGQCRPVYFVQGHLVKAVEGRLYFVLLRWPEQQAVKPIQVRRVIELEFNFASA
jgi:hypothetical protein